MKRVERRGTLDNQLSNPNMASTAGSQFSHSGFQNRGSQHAIASERSVQRTDTLPANHHHSASSRSGSQFGPAGTHLISPPASFQHDRYRDEVHQQPRPLSSSNSTHERNSRNQRTPPSPPAAIATLPGTGEDSPEVKNGSSRHSDRHSSVDRRPSSTNGHRNGSLAPATESKGAPPRRSPLGSEPSAAATPKKIATSPMEIDADADADPDADADADADAEADVDDADLELLEAVDAAEANSSSTEARPKTEDEEVDALAHA